MNQMAAVEAVLRATLKCPEVGGVFLKGSLAKGTADEYSDVDFYCLVEPVDVSSFLRKRFDLLQSYRPMIYHK